MLRVIDRPAFNGAYNAQGNFWGGYVNALKNACIWNLQREDMSIVAIGRSLVSGAYAVVEVASIADLSEDMGIYIKSGNYDVSGVITGFLGTTFVITNILWTEDTTGGFLNYTKQNYEVQATLQYGNYAIYRSDVLIKAKPSPTGAIEINVSSLLRNLIEKEIDLSYSGVCEQDLSGCGYFWIRYREVWKNVERSYSEDKRPYQFNNAVLQPIREENNIMKEWDTAYFKFPGLGATVVNLAKFLSVFEEPEYFAGYPFSISLYNNILGFDTESQGFAVYQQLKDINKDNISLEKGNMPSTDFGWVQHIYLSDNVDCDVSYVEIWAENEERDCADNCYVEPEYVECEYVGC